MTDSLLIHLPHSSTLVPTDVRREILLDDADLAKEIRTITDLYTDELFILDGAARVRNEHCRIVFDPERFRNDRDEPMAACGMGAIYALLEKTVSAILDKRGQCLIIDGHSFTSRPLPFEKDQAAERPDICIGTDSFHAPEALTAYIEQYLVREGLSTRRNTPFAGAITPMKHYRRDDRVGSVMIKVNRKLSMDEETGEKLPGFGRVQAFIHGLLQTIAGRHEAEERQ